MVVVREKVALLERQQSELAGEIEGAHVEDPTVLAERIRGVLDAYEAADAAGRNALLKSVISDVWYTKAKKTKPLDFLLDVHLRAR